MSLYRHPDPTIADWLADGPMGLSAPARDAVKTAIRSTRQRRVVVVALPRYRLGRLVLVAALLFALSIAVALFAGMLPSQDADPQTTLGPTQSLKAHLVPTVPPDPFGNGTGVIRGPGTTLEVEYTLQQDLDLTIGKNASIAEPYVGIYFTAGSPLQYGGSPTDVWRGHGVVVTDLKDGRADFSNGQAQGIDARTLFERLSAHRLFDVGPITETTLAGYPALTAEITGSHLDGVAKIDFQRPSRLIAADIRGGIVAVQIWAGTPAGLAAWEPQAMTLVSTFRFTDPASVSCWTNPPTTIALPDATAISLPTTDIAVDLASPGPTLNGATQPGVLGLAEGAPGLSYGWVGGEVLDSHGIVVADVTRADRHRTTDAPDAFFGTSATALRLGLSAEPYLFVANPGEILTLDGQQLASMSVRFDRMNLTHPWSHLDRIGATGRDCAVDFNQPNRTVVADVDGRILLVQVWATRQTGLQDWLPTAREVIQSMKVRVGQP